MGARSDGWPRCARSGVLLVIALLAAVLAVGSGPAGAAPKTPPGDPPGNNGTVKIRASDPTEDPNDNAKGQANQPRIDGCLFWVSFIGFDKGQTADITFTAQAPTGKGEVLLTDKGVPISDDAAGGGQDQDVVIPYNLTSAVQGLKATKQGYHIKLSSNTIQAPGGAKHKVFWINCTPAPPTALRVAKATQGTGKGPFNFSVTCNHRPSDTTFALEAGGKSNDITGIPPGTTCAVTETPIENVTTTVAEGPTADDAADGKVKLVAGTVGIVTFTNKFPTGDEITPAPDNSDLPAIVAAANKANPGSLVLGETLTAPPGTVGGTTLPRTGEDPGGLLAAGLWAVSAGSLALAAGRRRRRQ